MIGSFGEFFRAVWGFNPYPWQERLAEDVFEGGWPSMLDLPTGSGKTAVLDIALHHLLADGGRTAPRRIVLVVDRRVIVDQVALRAKRLLSAIERAASPATKEAREVLREIVGEGPPLLESAVLRGGVMQSDTWAHYPHVPVLAASTVDQIGSRLLFRGYGLSQRAQPMHAGLLGCDTLLLLDEVHLARPFADTLDHLSELRGPEGEVPRRTTVVQLSATPGEGGANGHRPFHLAEEDRSDPRLSQILTATKPAGLVEVKVTARAEEGAKREAVAEEAAKEATAMIAEGRRAIAIVVNRVDTARRVWDRLGSGRGFQRMLLTGRMRPIDQRAALREVEPRVVAGRDPGANGPPLILVATQCIEAGADYDFDGLITECASLDALRQRFGRLDRRGECQGRIGQDARAVVLVRSDQKSGDDPVYGDSLWNTWTWLREVEGGNVVDFGMEPMTPLLEEIGEEVDELVAPHRPAPVMLPTYLEQWAQTNPRPHADPDVALFLHGIPEEGRSALPDVQVIWRADVTEEDLGDTGSTLPRLIDGLTTVPPGSLEALSLPIWTVKKWLSDHHAFGDEDHLSDVEGIVATGEAISSSSARVLAWRGRRESQVIAPEDIAPGMTIVVPATRGGIGPHGTFDPDATDAVSDVGDVVQLIQRGLPTLRLDGAVWQGVGQTVAQLHVLAEDVDVDGTVREVLLTLREGLAAAPNPPLEEILDSIGGRPRMLRLDSGSWVALGRRQRPNATGIHGAAVEPSGGGEEDDESFPGSEVCLSSHLDAVGTLAADFGTRLGLSSPLVATLRWAGRLHDVGKADPRFQLLLHGGDEVAARFGATLAKSPLPWQDAAARKRSRLHAGYPDGQRHELVGLGMVEGSETLRRSVEANGADWELVLHLVGSHHGWCRPLAPAVSVPPEKADPVTWDMDGLSLSGTTNHGFGRLDSGVVLRFFKMARKYGWHELAYLEAILRLADHRQSAREAGA